MKNSLGVQQYNQTHPHRPSHFQIKGVDKLLKEAYAQVPTYEIALTEVNLRRKEEMSCFI